MYSLCMDGGMEERIDGWMGESINKKMSEWCAQPHPCNFSKIMHATAIKEMKW